MAAVTVKPVGSEAEWNSFLKNHSEANFLQSWQWGDFHEGLGKTVFRNGFYLDGQLEGVMLSVVESAKRGRYLIVPGGPIIDWKKVVLRSAFVKEIEAQARSQKCVFVRVRPQLLSDQTSKKLFANLGFRHAPTHLHAELTHQLDLTLREDELFSKMRKGTRYELKKSLKEGIEVSSTADPGSIDGFYQIQLDTAKRQGFTPFSLKFLKTQFAVFAANHKALLYTARLNDEILAQAFIIFWGEEAVYHYGASTEAGRKHPGAYAIQWEAIKEAQRRKMSRYNFWGVAPPGQSRHRFAGISVFKRGFSGEDVEYLHAQDLVVNWPRYALNLLVEELRRRMRRV